MHLYISSMLWLIHIIFPNISTELWPLIDFRIMFMLNIFWNNSWIWSNLADTLIFFLCQNMRNNKNKHSGGVSCCACNAFITLVHKTMKYRNHNKWPWIRPLVFWLYSLYCEIIDVKISFSAELYVFWREFNIDFCFSVVYGWCIKWLLHLIPTRMESDCEVLLAIRNKLWFSATFAFWRKSFSKIIHFVLIYYRFWPFWNRWHFGSVRQNGRVSMIHFFY